MNPSEEIITHVIANGWRYTCFLSLEVGITLVSTSLRWKPRKKWQIRSHVVKRFMTFLFLSHGLNLHFEKKNDCRGNVAVSHQTSYSCFSTTHLLLVYVYNVRSSMEVGQCHCKLVYRHEPIVINSITLKYETGTFFIYCLLSLDMNKEGMNKTLGKTSR